MMRTIQEIFNAVIDGGYYSNGHIDGKTSGYMCVALTYAYAAEHITAAENHLAVEEIEKYLKGYIFLKGALSMSNLPDKYEDRLAIYRNWANRPQLR